MRCFVTTQKIPNTKLVATAVDISKEGMRFSLDPDTAAWQPFGKGDPVVIEVVLPADHDFGERCIHGRGSVVRVDLAVSGEGMVAVDFDKVSFKGLETSVALAAMPAVSTLEM